MKYEFTVEEINIILAALGKAPYESVFQLVDSIRNQYEKNQEPPVDNEG